MARQDLEVEASELVVSSPENKKRRSLRPQEGSVCEQCGRVFCEDKDLSLHLKQHEEWRANVVKTPGPKRQHNEGPKQTDEELMINDAGINIEAPGNPGFPGGRSQSFTRAPAEVYFLPAGVPNGPAEVPVKSPVAPVAPTRVSERVPDEGPTAEEAGAPGPNSHREEVNAFFQGVTPDTDGGLLRI